MAHSTSQRLTDKVAKAAEAPAKGQALNWDTEIRGFALRVTAAGAKSFVLDYRADGRKRRYTIGRYPEWSVEAARREAKDLRRSVDRGEDPMGERHEDRQAATVKRLWELYERDHLPHKRDADRDREMWKADVKPALGNMKVADVRRADVRELHRKVSRRAPIRANRVLALVSKMFTLAATDYEIRADNPAKGIQKNPEERRERYLSQAEIAAVSKALAEYPAQDAANAVRWLLLTGCRKSEALAMTWDQVDLQAGVWTKPSAHTKQKKTHRVPLSAPAVQLLHDIAKGQRAGERYVFPGRKPGEPLKQLHTVWNAVKDKAGVQDVRLHDLRHTYASILVSAGLSLPMIGALLGHTQQATTQRYAHLYDDPLREATERVGAVVSGEQGQGADVVPLRKNG
jgi:integrase